MREYRKKKKSAHNAARRAKHVQNKEAVNAKLRAKHAHCKDVLNTKRRAKHARNKETANAKRRSRRKLNKQQRQHAVKSHQAYIRKFNSAAPDGPLHEQTFVQECVQEFRDKESSLELEWCHHCHERWFKEGGHSVIKGQYHCKRCTSALKRVAAGKDRYTLFGKDNLMTPGPYPADCPRLTWIEE